MDVNYLMGGRDFEVLGIDYLVFCFLIVESCYKSIFFFPSMSKYRLYLVKFDDLLDLL